MGTEERWNELKEKIKSCIKTKRKKKYKATLEHKFRWDRECRKENWKTKRAYKKWRKE